MILDGSTQLLRRLERGALVWCALAAAAVLAIAPSRTDILLGIAGGGVLAIVSFYAIRGSVDAAVRALAPAPSPNAPGDAASNPSAPEPASGPARPGMGSLIVKMSGRYALLALLAYIYDCSSAPASPRAAARDDGAGSLGHRRSGSRPRPARLGVIARTYGKAPRTYTMHHEFWIVTAVNRLLGGTVASIAHALGFTLDPAHAIPAHIVMSVIVVLAITALAVGVKSRLSIENPGKVQILLEDLVGSVLGILREYIGPKGDKYLPLIGSVGLFIFVANAMGKIPGLMSLNEHQRHARLRHHRVGVLPPDGVPGAGRGQLPEALRGDAGAPLRIAPLVLIIELISHASRVLSLSLRLFGNVFGEEMVARSSAASCRSWRRCRSWCSASSPARCRRSSS